MVLARREAIACAQDDDDTVEAVRHATRLFLRDHLGRFAPALGVRLDTADPHGFYGALGALTAGVVLADCARLDAMPGAAGLPLRAAADDAVPMACGTCDLAPGAAHDD
jgi:hypothetical protein